MKTVDTNLIRLAGGSAVLGGSLFVVMQAIHPPETLAMVTTSGWATVHGMGVVMSLLNIVGLAGIYARQARKMGLIGLFGFLLLETMWLLTAGFQFLEGAVLPLLAAEAPRFVEGFQGISGGRPSDVDLGLLPTLNSIASAAYLVGGILLGFATFRARILPRWAGVVLAGATVAPVILGLTLPHELVRLAAIPMGVALVALGVALWSERPGSAAGSPTRSAPAARPVVAANGGEA